jgi:hypothetical protein
MESAEDSVVNQQCEDDNHSASSQHFVNEISNSWQDIFEEQKSSSNNNLKTNESNGNNEAKEINFDFELESDIDMLDALEDDVLYHKSSSNPFPSNSQELLNIQTNSREMKKEMEKKIEQQVSQAEVEVEEEEEEELFILSIALNNNQSAELIITPYTEAMVNNLSFFLY